MTGVNGDDVRIDAVKRVWHQNAERARALLKELEVESPRARPAWT